MKILHVITSLHTNGAETLVCNMIPRLMAKGHEVDLVVFNGINTSLMEKLEREHPECKIYKLGSSYYNPWYIVKLTIIMRKYDIIHTHNSSPQLFVAIANIICKKRIITTEHSTNNRKREYGGILRLLDKWMYRQYDSVVCISDIAEKTLRLYLKGKQNNICTINNGVDVEAFRNAQSLDGLKTDKFVIVMVAGFREAKDQDTVIWSISKLPKDKFELWLVGDGDRRKVLEALVDDLGLQNCVKFLGLRTNVANILKSADVVVMSSHWEGMSLSNIEGMSVGKPFIASDVNGLREVTQGYGLLFPHEDAEALANIIQRLHNDRQYYQRVAEDCLERAKQFDISTMVDAYNMVYKGLASS